jgi:hypothetical protein
MMRLIEAEDWGEYASLIAELKAGPYWDIFYGVLERLDRSALYSSPVHGEGHIERVMLHGAFCAMSELLSDADARLLMDMCSYHDTGRANDWLDADHGLRSAMKLERLTGRSGEDLLIMKAGVEAHSLGDKALDEVIEKYGPRDKARAKRLAELLKDADGLDRVRINDLNVKYLRRQSSRSRAAFAQYLFDRYSALAAEGPAPEFKDGFEPPAVISIRRLVEKTFAEGLSCAQTMLVALASLHDTEIGSQLMDACSGLEGLRSGCGLIDAALLFIGLYFRKLGFAKERIRELCDRYALEFARQYTSDRCSEIRRAVGATHGCGSLAVDAALFACRFINENTKK